MRCIATRKDKPCTCIKSDPDVPGQSVTFYDCENAYGDIAMHEENYSTKPVIKKNTTNTSSALTRIAVEQQLKCGRSECKDLKPAIRWHWRKQ